MKEAKWRKSFMWGVLLFSILGCVLSYYGTNLTYRLALTGLTNPGGCTINEWISCDAVMATRFAKMFGIPVAWFGFLYYLFTSFLTLYSIVSKDSKHSTTSVAIAIILAIGAVLFSIFKLNQLITMQVICPVCFGMYIANFAILVLLIKSQGLSFKNVGSFLGNFMKSVFGNNKNQQFSHQPMVYAIFITWVFIIGYLGVYFFEKDIPKQKAFNLEKALDEHFNQTVINIKLDSSVAFRGNTKSGVTLVEFSDFECPSCGIMASQLNGLLLEYHNDVSLHFMNFPLDKSSNRNLKFNIHKNAGIAAIASVCAMKQGDFWSYHDALFRNQKKIDRDFLIQLAKQQGWDPIEFSDCMDSQETKQWVLNNIKLGEDIKVQGTPYLYINGRKVKYWNNVQFIRAVIDEELKRLT